MFRYIKIISFLYIALYLGGCSSGMSGKYGGDGRMYDLNFKPDGKVYISASIFGMKIPESAGTYEVDEERVIVKSSDGRSIVFKKKNGNLVTALMGEEMECKKL